MTKQVTTIALQLYKREKNAVKEKKQTKKVTEKKDEIQHEKYQYSWQFMLWCVMR